MQEADGGGDYEKRNSFLPVSTCRKGSRWAFNQGGQAEKMTHQFKDWEQTLEWGGEGEDTVGSQQP